jgi:arylsulfatase A-like enzyme
MSRPGKNQKLNLLVLMTDQQRTDTLGFLGRTPCRTPNLDRVAREGVVFSNALTPTPLCSPARASIHTGRYAHSHRCIDNCVQPAGGTPTGLPGLDPAERTLSELLTAGGVACSHSGKWHLGRENERQRDFVRFTSHRDPAYLEGLRRRGIKWDEMGVFEDLEYRQGAPFCGRSPLSADDNRDAFVARNAVSMLDDLASGKNPFALWCSFYGPHQPFSVPAPWDRMYRPEDVVLPPNFTDDCTGKPAHVAWDRLNHKPNALDEAGWRRVLAHYWGYVSFLDSLFGKVLDRLVELGLWENTAVVFISDHGEMLGDHRMFGKGLCFYDGIMRTPLMIRVPGCRGGRVEEGLANLIDFVPTALDILGQPIPASVQGRSHLPCVRDGAPTGQDAVFGEHHGRPGPERKLMAGRMVRTRDHKFCLYTTGEEELYDLAADPGELVNLAGDSRCGAVKADLRKRLEDWMRRTGDFYPNTPAELVANR